MIEQAAPLDPTESEARFLTHLRAIMRDARAICANKNAAPETQEMAYLAHESIRELMQTDFLDHEKSWQPLSKRSIFLIGYWAGSLALGGGVMSDHPKEVRRRKASAAGSIGAAKNKVKADAWKKPAEAMIIAEWEADKCLSNDALAEKAEVRLRAMKGQSRSYDSILLLVKDMRKAKKIPKAQKSPKRQEKQRL